MKITESKLRRIIRDTLKEAYVPSQELDFGDSPGYVDDYEYEEWKIIFPRRASPIYKEWIKWYYSIIPNWKDSTNDPLATELRVSYYDRHHRTNPRDAKIRVMAHNSGRFMARMPPQDASGHAEIKLVKRV